MPVFHEGEHLFTVGIKAHQADVGNSQPTTYFAAARDVYHEGALIFPCVQVQRDYRDIDDIVRMCRRRIRVPDQWFGDYLAAIGAARIGERRLKAFIDKYGAKAVRPSSANGSTIRSAARANRSGHCPAGVWRTKAATTRSSHSCPTASRSR